MLALTKPGKTFCVYPWFGVYVDDNKYRTCCQFRPQQNFSVNDYTIDEFRNSEYQTGVRARLDAGEQIPECTQCWTDEAHGVTSMRQMAAPMIFPDMRVAQGLKPTKPLLSVDMKIGSTCNFACAMCNPADSTKLHSEWIKDQDNEFVKDYTVKHNDYFNYTREIAISPRLDVLDSALSSGIVHLNILGGEPLLYKNAIDKLANVDVDRKNKITLSFVTNGSQPLVPVVEKLQGYKRVNIQVSLEGVGNTQDYIRKHSVWSDIEHNVLNFRALDSSKHTLTVVNLIQALSVENTTLLSAWCNKHEITLRQDLLYNPNYLNINSLSTEFINSLPSHPSFSEHEHVPEQRDRLRRFVAWYETRHALKLKDISPGVYNDIS